MKVFWALLLAFGCPADVTVVIDPHLDKPGYYQDGKLYLRPDADANVARHECVHAKQPKATNQREWDLNEHEARMAELRAREE